MLLPDPAVFAIARVDAESAVGNDDSLETQATSSRTWPFPSLRLT